MTGRGLPDQAAGRGHSRGHGRRKASSGTAGNSGSSPYTLTIPLHFLWDVEHNITIRKIFDHRIGRRLQKMLDDVRQRRNHLTTWLQPDIKKALLVHWETDDGFMHRHLTNRANRTSAM
ncbi:hypothetical protein Ahy_A05g025315 [Arachis hypogaea]|uniref:Uncharacterized protein n=1 Tax=Arachis hypogaea TaxID=3818 RepID=A0A445D808_ARAHY|nr:hypothetical protein Ahy_A05g025315 [Arachis hypogaea]